MKKKLKSTKKNQFPKGWDEDRVRGVIRYYEQQTDEAAAAEDDSIFKIKPKPRAKPR
jgi:hypothetical protein